MNLHEICDISKINCLIDLHLHLDGSLSLKTIKDLALVEGKELKETDDEIVKKISISPDCRSLDDFLTKFAYPLSFLQTKETIKRAVVDVLKEQKEQGLIYCELRFAPQLHCEKGLTQDEVVEATLEGVKEASIPCTLILCAMRGADLAINLETVNVAKKYLNKGVGGLDLAGAEGLFKTNQYSSIFELAKKLEIPVTIHAGESDGYESVEEALNFGAKRIGHGTRSNENEGLLNRLFDEGITLEMCPTSNLQTCCISSLKEFPIIDYFSRGIRVTVNQDDPAISGITLKHEFEVLIKEFSLTYLEVKQLLLNSVNASFSSLDFKVKLSKQIKDFFDNI